ncbi:hypothetical protein [Paenibacillus dendritiformis]|uniref:hypothetical protein n=1 Tax=Paenibacillus dendritiformis TaxID=130049 RepID=UPI00111039AE|nr:hypothetical protein [Paenibacillus dendritiformis]CAH8769769.1 hypothetical protein H7S4_002501 [Paenibacillus dendritiformis]
MQWHSVRSRLLALPDNGRLPDKLTSAAMPRTAGFSACLLRDDVRSRCVHRFPPIPILWSNNSRDGAFPSLNMRYTMRPDFDPGRIVS